MVDDILLFPHCDLHVSLAHAPQLNLRVFHRGDPANPGGPYALSEITSACKFDFFAPDLAAGHRFDNVPQVDPATGRVTATTTGRYLFLVRFTTGPPPNDFTRSIVGSLQVHADVLEWWFGNTSITTALDPTIGHSLPSVYARFSDDRIGADLVGTDLVGDITGHGYVPLTSADTGRVQVMPNGRLRGITEGSTTVSGSFLGVTNTLPVRVVDYSRPDKSLFPIQTPNVADFAKMHNVVFLAEGFRAEDQGRFDDLVTKTVHQLYNTARHQPYPMLEGHFNNFKVFSASREHALTVGYRVTGQDIGNLSKGSPIPCERRVSTNASVYTPAVLVAKVGLPKRGEARTRADLISEWRAKNLIQTTDEPRIDDALITVWEGQRSQSILDARDTFFGMILGGRPGDLLSTSAAHATPPPGPPATDSPGPVLDAFVARLYEYFRFPAARNFELDPRRHPPEVYVGWREANPQNSIIRFVAAQSYTYPPFHPIGPEWTPDPANFKASRGLVALVGNDRLVGGENINDFTITAQTIGNGEVLNFVPGTGGAVRTQRDPPTFDPEPQILVDTVAHEFGHSFALFDEYEVNDGDDPRALTPVDYGFDNVTKLSTIHFTGGGPRDIDPAKVKWLGLPRMSACDRIRSASVAHPDGYDILTDRHVVGVWKQAMKKNKEVVLRAIELGPTGKQLPLPTGSSHVLTNLRVLQVEEFTGLLRVGGPGYPAANPPSFAEGSLLYIPKIADGFAQTLGQRRVIGFISGNHQPLNVDTDHVMRKDGLDNPVSIPDFSAPCTSSRLIGVYEGAFQFAGAAYRPAGQCKMRSSTEHDGFGEGEFCHVCKWLIVNNVDPGMHAILDKLFYPGSKKNG